MAIFHGYVKLPEGIWSGRFLGSLVPRYPGTDAGRSRSQNLRTWLELPGRTFFWCGDCMVLVVSNMGFKKHRKIPGVLGIHDDFCWTSWFWEALTIFCWMSAMVGGTNSLAEAQIRVVTTFGEEIVPWSKPGQVRVFGIRVFFLEMGLRWNWSLVLSVTWHGDDGARPRHSFRKNRWGGASGGIVVLPQDENRPAGFWWGEDVVSVPCGGPPENEKGLAEQVQKGPFRKRAAAFQMVIGHSLETAWDGLTSNNCSREQQKMLGCPKTATWPIACASEVPPRSTRQHRI